MRWGPAGKDAARSAQRQRRCSGAAQRFHALLERRRGRRNAQVGPACSSRATLVLARPPPRAREGAGRRDSPASALRPEAYELPAAAVAARTVPRRAWRRAWGKHGRRGGGLRPRHVPCTPAAVGSARGVCRRLVHGRAGVEHPGASAGGLNRTRRVLRPPQATELTRPVAQAPVYAIAEVRFERGPQAINSLANVRILGRNTPRRFAPQALTLAPRGLRFMARACAGVLCVVLPGKHPRAVGDGAPRASHEPARGVCDSSGHDHAVGHGRAPCRPARGLRGRLGGPGAFAALRPTPATLRANPNAQPTHSG